LISILQATAWYPPAYLGGTEVYLTGLVRELRSCNITSKIVAPLGPDQPDPYEYDGTTVRTYSVNEIPSRAELRGEERHKGFEKFSRILSEERPDIYHQHSWTRGLGSAHLLKAREAGLKTILTVHTPNVICLRGTMMRYGLHSCNGQIHPQACGACWSNGRGLPKIFARQLSALPPAISAALERSILPGRFATALGARALGERRREEFAHILANTDRIVAVSRWLFEALLANGVPANKLILCRQGIDPNFAEEANNLASRCVETRNVFRVLYLGRWHPVKGIDVLVRAMRAIPSDVPITLSIHGVGDGFEERAYRSYVRKLAAGDSRITIGAAVPHEQLALTLVQGSALAVPSLWMETGPLIVLEAKALGIPVIGSRLGGIAELVREPEDGVLVPPNDVQAWTSALVTTASRHIAQSRSLKPLAVRTLREVANEMAALYAALL